MESAIRHVESAICKLRACTTVVLRKISEIMSAESIRKVKVIVLGDSGKPPGSLILQSSFSDHVK